MGKFKGRNAVACIPCHSQKVKCNGEAPCERCIQKGRECTFPEKKPKLISVSESYISELERDASRARDSESSVAGSRTTPTFDPNTGFVFEVILPETGVALKSKRFENESSTERLVHQLKGLTLSTTSAVVPETHLMEYTSLHGGSDYSVSDLTVKLPPMPLALRLLEKFEEVFCDCHWFMRRDFKEQLYFLYSDSTPRMSNRRWLCRVSLVFALAATFIYEQDSPDLKTYANMETPEAGATWQAPLPPGFGLFEQARKLLVSFPEEPSTEDIEILNLMAFYCYTLNRRKTTFLYASQSVALAKLLQLDKPSTLPTPGSPYRNLENSLILEHQKRLWWTCFFMDRMISAELGLNPTLTTFPVEITPPSSKNISPDDLDQFFDSNLFELQIWICELKLQVSRVEHLLQSTSEYNESIIQSIEQSLDSLHEFRARIPGYMSFEFSAEFPTALYNLPWARGVATLYLRYHQCYTVLLRPLYYRRLALLLQGAPNAELNMAKMATVISCLKEQGLQSAQSNCRIILDLFHRGRNARYGYWDSAHLFSGLVILSLSRIMEDHESDELSESDHALYAGCRAILHDMAGAGNPAAKDHEAYLADVESIVAMLISGSNATVDESDNPLLSLIDFGVNESMDDNSWPDVHWSSLG